MGDSLGLPRNQVPFQMTWLYKLSCKYDNIVFVNGFKRELTSNGLSSLDSLENYSPDTVILQLGIVDCAPRYFRKQALFPKIINHMPKVVSSFYWKWHKKMNKRKLKNAFVNKDKFKANLEKYLSRCMKNKVDDIVIIKIQKPGKNMLDKNPSILEAVESYNMIIANLETKFKCHIIDPLCSGDDKHYVDDGYHLNENGFDQVMNELLPLID